ncbi:hypothetical protein UFOVP972_257 [uncultured Caudovirales phage]|jgi:hypothetical protein|uniref:Uncharacterized protein n=1 Tax=uncultured Caudovirales phage TaxID=2100421 RepID=A0A6J5PUU6_9CAUD|nr:hypothetical protein UFOVP972_257 [uncultured Caudovirales phage]
MALVKTVLDKALADAFKAAMLEFITVARTSSEQDVSNAAISAASTKFSSLAATAIDSYIKSATVIIPAGQVVATVPATGAGSTSSPSLPATIT